MNNSSNNGKNAHLEAMFQLKEQEQGVWDRMCDLASHEQKKVLFHVQYLGVNMEKILAKGKSLNAARCAVACLQVYMKHGCPPGVFYKSIYVLGSIWENGDRLLKIYSEINTGVIDCKFELLEQVKIELFKFD